MHTLRRISLVLVVATMFDVFAGAEQTVARPPGVPAPQQAQAAKPLEAGTALVRGQVVEADSTTGVADAVVTLAGPALGQTTAVSANGVVTTSASIFTDGTPAGSRRVATDAQGRFLFRNVPAGVFTMTVTASGYMNGGFGETRPIQIRRTLDLVRTLDVRDGERPVPVTIRVWKHGGISGVVLDEANEPVVGVPVAVLSRMTDWGGPVMQSQMSTTTDDRGSYHADVPPGDYLVAVLASTSTVPATAVDGFLQAIAEGGTAQQAYLNGIMASGGLLPRGAGVRTGDFLVNQLALGNRPSVPPIVTRDGLTFYPTTYHPSSTMATSATLITLQSGEEKSGVDIHLRPVPMRRVSGLVMGPNGPVPNLTLRLVAQDPAVRRTSPATVIDASQALSDGNGAFTFIGVAPGAYTLAAFRAATAQATALWASSEVSIAETDIDDLHLALRTGTSLTGRIVFEGNSDTLPPSALRTIAIVPRPIPGSTAAFQQNIGIARADPATLQFTTAPIVPGPYTITVNGIPSSWILKSATVDGANVADQAFDLPASGVSEVVVTITDRISTLAGVARDAEGRPMPSATISVFPTDKSLWRLPGVASRRVQTAAPARDGRYTIRGLPAGEYFVVAADWPTADFSDGTVLTKLIPSASRVRIDDGGSRTQDLRVVVIR